LANFYTTSAPPLVSDDRTATLIAFVMAGDFDDNSDNISDVVDVVHAAKGQEGFAILITGQATIGLDNRELGQEDLAKGEAFGVPIALIILIVVLGALAAALIPLVMAIVSIVVALGAAALVAQAFELSFFVRNIITMIGLAVGIGYSLFVVSRYREERSRGMEKIDAISHAGNGHPSRHIQWHNRGAGLGRHAANPLQHLHIRGHRSYLGCARGHGGSHDSVARNLGYHGRQS
jgi:RND superfamily putative drug exporter